MIYISRIFPSGDYLLSREIAGAYYRHRYSGYTRKEALREFRALCREISGRGS